MEKKKGFFKSVDNPNMKKDFLDTQKLSEEITLKKARLKGVKKIVTESMKVFFPLF